MTTSTDTNATTSLSSRRRCSLTTRSTRTSTQTKFSVPAVISIPCQVRPLNRWSTDATSAAATEDCLMRKSTSFRWDEENNTASSVFTARASVSLSSSACSVISNDEMESSLRSVDDKAVRRCSETPSKLGCQASSIKTARRSSIGPPTLPRRQRSNVGLVGLGL